MSIQSIFDDCGIDVRRYHQVHGGDINDAYCLYGHDAKYFLKVNDAKRYEGMFRKEANGLNELLNYFPGKIPNLIKSGITQPDQYLLLEWIEAVAPTKNSWEKFGTALAKMHLQAQPYFGWKEDNYIGSLVQYNTKSDSWPVFYINYRIMPLVQILVDTGVFSSQYLSITESFCKHSKQFFPQEPAALLHGDLWSGNCMMTTTGDPALYDPAVYYGHREMDLGMTKLFGGFDQQFYDAYNEVYPLEKNWLRRLPLTQLYPLLVHAILFGGQYVNRARQILTQFSAG